MSDDKVLEAIQADDMSYPVDSLTPEEAHSEYHRTFQDPKYTGGEYENPWVHKKRVERMSKLWEKAHPEKVKFADERAKSENPNLFDKLTKEGVTKETLQADEDRIAEREDKEAMEKARKNLELYFGGDKEADAAVKAAKGIFKRFATSADITFVEKSGLGNDPEFIQKLAEINQILQRGGRRR
jgi:hypothetical protein